ncbi:phasin family protein [Rhodoplanes sp. Z2-YC6860]|uniref:phasin family protein n=1 Tax=Rhodoplanes sp. Z2-YC6860 TaxID=674703 RepID=UPI00082B58F2|nr:phasin family protein [Rhodoplanes sp. Z2-YC6860]
MAKSDTSAGEHAQNGFGNILAGQSALFRELNAVGQHWVDAAQAQLNVTAELMSHLASAHTLPDFVTAYQECAAKRLALASEESRRLLDDCQRCMTAATKSFSNGFTPSASS